jgi:hypothetical protein
MANITKKLATSNTFIAFDHRLGDWVGVELLDPDKEEILVGYEVVQNPIQNGDGDVSIVPNIEPLAFKGIFENQAAFETAHSPLVNDTGYYDEELEIDRRYVDGVYEEVSHAASDFSMTYSGTYGAGVFPNTSIKWKNICTQEEFAMTGWPPPNDPMTRFIYEINVDTGSFKARDVKIKYHVRIVTTDAVDPTDITIEHREDTYTYEKQIQNTMGQRVSSALKDHFDSLPVIDYTTCELLSDKPDEPTAIAPPITLPEEEEEELKTPRLQLAFPPSDVAGDYALLPGTAGNRTIVREGSIQSDDFSEDWAVDFNETVVLDSIITSRSTSNPTENNWQLKIGKGGQIYSLKTDALGETVPPQYRSSDGGQWAPWVDEVWQTVSVYNNGGSKFNHSAGIYIKDPILTEPFYTPRLATEIDQPNKSFYSMNWMQPAGKLYTEDNPSHIINLTKYKDLGDGVIEVTLGMYNFGSTETYNYHNMPWGGVRRTALEYNYTSNIDQTTYTQMTGKFADTDFATRTVFNTDQTGGWTTFCSENSGDYGQSMGVVFGKDEQLENTYQKNRIRQGYTQLTPESGETDWRNYTVFTLNVRHYLNQGEGIWTRQYFVFGETRADVENKIKSRDLVDKTLFEDMNITEDSVDLIGYQIATKNVDVDGTIEEKFDRVIRGESPVFYLYSAPVSGSIPIFEMVKANGERIITHNPYTIGTYKMYDTSVVSEINMLGFASITDDRSAALDTIFLEFPENYIADEGVRLNSMNGALYNAETEEWEFTNSPGIVV